MANHDGNNEDFFFLIQHILIDGNLNTRKDIRLAENMSAYIQKRTVDQRQWFSTCKVIFPQKHSNIS